MDEAALEQVLRRAARREPAALSALVEAYSPRLFGLLYRLTGSREAAEDLLQETFLRVVRCIHAYEHDGRFEAWLFRIAANLARDHARCGRRRGQPAANGPLADETLSDPRGVPPGRAVEQQEVAARLSAGLARLSQPDREILLLRHYAGLSFREIAEVLGIPLGTALARAHRALARLREAMNEP